jgi:transposase
MIHIFKDKIRSYIYYEYLNGKSATEAYKTLQQLPPEYHVARNTVKLWYGRFNSGDYSLSDHIKIGRPIKVDKQKIFKLIELDPTLTSSELAEKVGCSRSLVSMYLSKEGYTWKLSKWIPAILVLQSRRNVM